MVGSERFSYLQSEELNTQYKRSSPASGAPYVLCIFAVGVILMGVGTFITTHALEEHAEDQNHIHVVVGPVLLGFGGLLLLSAVVVCMVACCKNSRLQESISDDLLNIGSSTFYGGKGFAYLVNENQSSSTNQLHLVGDGGIENPVGPPMAQCHPQDEGIILLANTVAQERNRQRKMSRKYLSNSTANINIDQCHENNVAYDHNMLNNPHLVVREQFLHDNRIPLDHLGLERLRRVDPYPELADFDLGEGASPQMRDRSASVYTKQPHPSSTPVPPQRLRRNVTYSAASRARIMSKRQQDLKRQQQQPVNQELQSKSSPQWRKRSLQRKDKDRKNSTGIQEVKVHQLPKFDQGLLSAMGITPASREISESECNSDPPLSRRQRHDDQKIYPNHGHGSLHHPRRRPSMAMGVRGVNVQQPSGSAYRHRSSIYASDMSLHVGREGTHLCQESIAEDVPRQEEINNSLDVVQNNRLEVSEAQPYPRKESIPEGKIVPRRSKRMRRKKKKDSSSSQFRREKKSSK